MESTLLVNLPEKIADSCILRLLEYGEVVSEGCLEILLAGITDWMMEKVAWGVREHMAQEAGGNSGPSFTHSRHLETRPQLEDGTAAGIPRLHD